MLLLRVCLPAPPARAVLLEEEEEEKPESSAAVSTLAGGGAVEESMSSWEAPLHLPRATEGGEDMWCRG